jgi:hypothetical protein
MGKILDKILSFFKYDFFPNLAFYLLQVFLIVLMVLVFAGVNIVVRIITDPLCIKVFRMKEHKRGPGMVAMVITVVICAFLLVISYNAFPQLQPTVIGWTGKQVQKVVTWDWEDAPKQIEKKLKGSMPGTIPDLKKSFDKATPAKQPKEPKPVAAPATP